MDQMAVEYEVSKADIDLRVFIHLFHNRLPQVVRIGAGSYGLDTTHTYGADEVGDLFYL